MNLIHCILDQLDDQLWKTNLIHPGLMTAGMGFFAAVVGGGFLYVVGVRTLSCLMALAYLGVLLFIGLCMAAGSYWRIIDGFQTPGSLDAASKIGWSWRLFIEGFQLILFYSFLSLFLVACIAVFYPFSLIIPILLIVFHPMLFLPLVGSTHDRTMLGLLDACLECPRLLRHHYWHLWAETTLFLLLMTGIAALGLISFAAMTVVGIPLIPGIIWTFLLAYGRLYVYLVKPAIRRPDAQDMVYVTVSSALGHSSSPFAMGSTESPWQSPNQG